MDLAYIPNFVTTGLVFADGQFLLPMTSLQVVLSAYLLATTLRDDSPRIKHDGNKIALRPESGVDKQARASALALFRYIKRQIRLVIDAVDQVVQAQNTQLDSLNLGGPALDSTLREIGNSADFYELREHLLAAYAHFMRKGYRPLSCMKQHLELLEQECNKHMAYLQGEE